MATAFAPQHWVDDLLQICCDLAAGVHVLPVEAWVTHALTELPAVLEAADTLHGCIVVKTGAPDAARTSVQLRRLQAGALRALARLALGRDARPHELIAWQAGLDAGDGMRALRHRLMRGPEAQLARTYRRITGRSIAPGERHHWLTRMNEGLELGTIEARLRARFRGRSLAG